MRPPRHQFSDDVRSTARAMASRMLRDGSVAHTSDELKAWLSGEPEFRGVLEREGYGRLFTAEDLFPLLGAMVTRSQATSPSPRSAKLPRGSRWLLALGGLLLTIVVVALLVAVVTA